jgi:hypothetical protein
MRAKAKLMTVVCVLMSLAIAIPIAAQQRAAAADPVTGMWTGDWGPSATDRNLVTVDLKWDGKAALTGIVKSTRPARPDVTLLKSSFTAATNTIHMEADSKNPEGTVVHFVIDGKLANGMMTGSWNHGTTKGDFKLTK